jgi:hypothetical protein
MDFFLYPLALKGGSGCVMTLDQTIEGTEMVDDSDQITALKRVPTRTQCRRTAALFCRFRRLKAGGTREFHSIEGKLISH